MIKDIVHIVNYRMVTRFKAGHLVTPLRSASLIVKRTWRLSAFGRSRIVSRSMREIKTLQVLWVCRC